MSGHLGVKEAFLIPPSPLLLKCFLQVLDFYWKISSLALMCLVNKLVLAFQITLQCFVAKENRKGDGETVHQFLRIGVRVYRNERKI